MAGRYEVRITRGAREDLAGARLPDRGRLTMELISASARQPSAGLLAVRSWRWLAACEVFPQRRLMLVYAVVEREALTRMLRGR